MTRTRRTPAVLTAAALAAGILAAAPPASAAGVVCGDVPADDVATTTGTADWFTRLNQYRTGAGLDPVEYSPVLDEYAGVQLDELRHRSVNGIPITDPHAVCGPPGGSANSVITTFPGLLDGTESLMIVPAHASWLMAPGLRAVGAATNDFGTDIYGVFQRHTGRPADYQWPLPGTTISYRTMRGAEHPDPIAGCGQADPDGGAGLAYGSEGAPVWASFPADPGPVDRAATQLADITTGTIVPTCEFIWQDQTPYTITLMPARPLMSGHEYRATAAGANLARTWSFSVRKHPMQITLTANRISGGRAYVRAVLTDATVDAYRDGHGPEGDLVVGVARNGTCAPIETQTRDGIQIDSIIAAEARPALTATTTYCASFTGPGTAGGTVSATPVTVTVPVDTTIPEPTPLPTATLEVTAVSEAGTLPYGTRVVIDGVLTGPGSGAQVILEQRGGNGAWTRVATGVSDGGAFEMTFPLRSSGPLRVRYAGGAGYAAVTTSAVTLRVTPLISGWATTGSSRTRTTVVLTPKVTPGGARRVTLQYLSGGSWRTWTSATATGSGSVTLKFRPAGKGTYRLRLHIAGDATAVALDSPVRLQHVR